MFSRISSLQSPLPPLPPSTSIASCLSFKKGTKTVSWTSSLPLRSPTKTPAPSPSPSPSPTPTPTPSNLPILSDLLLQHIYSSATEKLGHEILVENVATRIADCIEYHLPIVDGENKERATIPLLFVVGVEDINGLYAIACARVLFLRGWKNITIMTVFEMDDPSSPTDQNNNNDINNNSSIINEEEEDEDDINKNSNYNKNLIDDIIIQRRILKEIELFHYFGRSPKILPLDLNRIQRHQGIIVDGILGATGSNQPPCGVSKEAIEAIIKNVQRPTLRKEKWATTRRTPTQIVSIDIPSGLNPVTGESPGVCVEATYTINLHIIKNGQVETAARKYIGQLWSVEAAMGYITFPIDPEDKLKEFYKESPIRKVF